MSSFTSTLVDFKHKTSNLERSLNKKIFSCQNTKRELWDNMEEQDWDNCRKSWAELDDDTDNIFKIMEQHKKSTSEILALLEKVINKLENMEALSIYRDTITEFFEEVEARLGADVWAKVRAAINRKLRSKQVNYRRSEEEYISMLRVFLQEINMTVEDVELMMSLKKKSNAEFHQGELLGPEEIREKFETSFPKELKDFEDPLRKVFDALSNWDQDS